MLDSTIMNLALPSIQRGLHTTPGTLQWTIDAYVLTSAALILFGGRLGDRFGHTRMVLAGLGDLRARLCCLRAGDDRRAAGCVPRASGTGAAILARGRLSCGRPIRSPDAPLRRPRLISCHDPRRVDLRSG
jgi:MFS family permease